MFGSEINDIKRVAPGFHVFWIDRNENNLWNSKITYNDRYYNGP